MTRSCRRLVSSTLPGTPKRPRLKTLVAAGLAVFVLIATPFALAQEAPKPKKKGPKPAPSASAASPADSAAPEATAAGGAVSAAPNPAPATPPAAKPGELPNLPPEPEYDIWNTKETADKRYYFVGLQYRGTVIPQFLMNLFVNDGDTVYSNSIGAEIDIRKGGQSLIPWIKYTDYNTGDIEFYEKGQPGTGNNRSVVNSSLKALYLGIDELWSVPVANHLDFEFGFGVGVGAVWGDLMNNWVYKDAAGPLFASNGNHYSQCKSQSAPGLAANDPENGCNPANHTNHDPAKVGGYIEKNWFDGGPVPVVFPHISIPQFSLRYKPIKQFEARVSLGFCLTGFWFGLSADYGLERPEDSKAKVAHGLQVRDTL